MKFSLPYLNETVIDDFITNALYEDIGEGDHSSLASIPNETTGKAKLIVKDNGVIAGLQLARIIFTHADPDLKVEFYKEDGAQVSYGDVAFVVSGDVRSILASERLVLNCIQRMSGIATTTKLFIDAVAGTGAKILDTRKTTPNFRLPEKWAVAIGGGTNHRVGLYDMIILKDNHVDFAGGITPAIEKTVAYLKKNGLDLKIEIETRSLIEVEAALKVGQIHRIMLDNMNLIEMEKAVKLINKAYEVEASGGVTIESVRSIALTGVDYISVGGLTHSVKSLDFSLKAFN